MSNTFEDSMEFRIGLREPQPETCDNPFRTPRGEQLLCGLSPNHKGLHESGDWEWMDVRKGDPGYERLEELTQAERLEIPKCALASPEERIEQLCKTTSAWFYHHSLAARVNIELGEGEPLQLLLQDEFYRRKFRLSTRAL